KDIIASVKKYAPDVGEQGTLFIYMAGHGSPKGNLETNDGSFINFTGIRAALGEVRAGKKFKRLVVVVFSCYAGNWVDGPNAVGKDDGMAYGSDVISALTNQTITGAMDAFTDKGSYADAPFEQILV